MNRVPEPEVMGDPDQALAYARADFAGVNQAFAAEVLSLLGGLRAGWVLDLGCGPADIPLRLAAAAPGLRVVGVDASPAMLRLARQAIEERGGRGRVRVVCARVPDLPFARDRFAAIISNSLLHHLPDPGAFWDTLRRLGRPGTPVHVKDLFRPESVARAREIVESAAADEDPVLKEDFFNSLLAAFSPDEVRAQLDAAGLGHLRCRVVSERHWLVSGHL